MTQGTNVVNSWKHFERIFVEETLMEYLWARIYGAGDAKSVDILKGKLEAGPHPLSSCPGSSGLSLIPNFDWHWAKLSPSNSQSLVQFMSKQIPDFYFPIVQLSAFGRVCSPRDKMCHLSEVGNPDQALSLSSSPADRRATKNANWQLTYHCSNVFSNDENFQFLREGSNFGQGLRVQQE